MAILLDAALEYHKRGWSLIPMKMDDGKRPACKRWGPFQSERADEAKLRRWFGNANGYGIGVIFGAVSGGLASRDFDSMDGYTGWAAGHPDLARSLPTVETRQGRHVYFRATPEDVGKARAALGKPPGTGAIHCEDGELRAGVGCYSVLPPSQHPSGAIYRWLVPLCDELPFLDPMSAGFLFTPQLVPIWDRENGEHRENRGAQKRTERTEEDRSNDSFLVGSEAWSQDDVDKCAYWGRDVELALVEALPSGPGKRHRQVFELARSLKAIPALADADSKDLRPYVRLWHKAARAVIKTKPFEETWIDFLRAWPRVRIPKGCDAMAPIFAAACAVDPPPVAVQYEQGQLRLLVSVCRELQRTAGNGPFYLSCRTAGRLLGVPHSTAARWLFLLVSDRVLVEVSKGSQETKRASRYRYVAE